MTLSHEYSISNEYCMPIVHKLYTMHALALVGRGGPGSARVVLPWCAAPCAWLRAWGGRWCCTACLALFGPAGRGSLNPQYTPPPRAAQRVWPGEQVLPYVACGLLCASREALRGA